MKGFGLWIVVIVIFAAGFGCYNYVISNNNSQPQVEQQVDTAASQPQENKSVEKSNQAENDVLNVSDISKSLLGKTVTVKCLIKNVDQPKNTVFFDATDPSSGKSIKGVLFNKTNNDNAGRKELLIDSMNNKKIIFITGEVAEYKGNLEIKAWKVFTK